MLARDLAAATIVYADLNAATTAHAALNIDNLSTVNVEFRDNAAEKVVVYSATLAGEDMNAVAKVVRRQLLVDMNNLTAQLTALDVTV